MVGDRHTPGRDTTGHGLAVRSDLQEATATVVRIGRDDHEALALQRPHGVGHGGAGDPEPTCELGRPHGRGRHEPEDAHLDGTQSLGGRDLLEEDPLHLAEPLQGVGDRRGGIACYHCPSAT